MHDIIFDLRLQALLASPGIIYRVGLGIRLLIFVDEFPLVCNNCAYLLWPISLVQRKSHMSYYSARMFCNGLL